MKKFFIMCLSLFLPTMVYGYPLQGGISYTVETARIDAFSNVPLNINISDYQSHFIDPNYVANKNAMNKNKRPIFYLFFG